MSKNTNSTEQKFQDPFYSDANIAELKKRAAEMRVKRNVTEHELLDDEEKGV